MSFLNIIHQNKNARKIFGKKEIEIIEKQLLGISLTQTEKNILSRSIRKKLDFIDKVSKYSSQFRIKKGEIIERLIEVALDNILDDFLADKIKSIKLFGSYVENKMTFRSDVDISVEFTSITKKEATEFRIRTSGKLPERIDVQVYNVLPEKIKKEIDLKGKILYKNENK